MIKYIKDNQNLGFGLISFIIAIAIIGLLAGGGLYFKETQNQKSLLEIGLQKEKEAEALKEKILQQQKEQLESIGEGSNPKPKPQSTPQPTTAVDTSNWKTYRNEQYGFEVRYPADWRLEEKQDYPPYDRFYINKSISGLKGPVVVIAPIGWPAGELPGGKSIKKEEVIDGRKIETTNFLTEENAIWHQFMRFSEYGMQWTKENYLLTDIRGDVKAVCDIPITPTRPECGLGDPFKYLGTVNTEDRKIIDKILSTFKFTPLEK